MELILRILKWNRIKRKALWGIFISLDINSVCPGCFPLEVT